MEKEREAKVPNDQGRLIEIAESGLISHTVSFPKINFSCDTPVIKSENKDEKKACIRSMVFTISVNWKVLAIKEDKKGIVIGCNFIMNGGPYKLEIFIQTKIEFNKTIEEEQIPKTYNFQVLAAKIFFPYLIEMIASITPKMEAGTSPLILDSKLLDMIIESTIKQSLPNQLPKK